MIWSETLFLLLSVLFMIGCYRYFQTHSIRTLLVHRGDRRPVTASPGMPESASLRMGGLLMLCDGRLRWGPERSGIYFCLASSPFSSRRSTFTATGASPNTLTGYREKAIRSLGVNLHDFGSVFCDWLPFFNERYGWATVIALLFILLITGIFILRLVRETQFFFL